MVGWVAGKCSLVIYEELLFQQSLYPPIIHFNMFFLLFSSFFSIGCIYPCAHILLLDYAHTCIYMHNGMMGCVDQGIKHV